MVIFGGGGGGGGGGGDTFQGSRLGGLHTGTSHCTLPPPPHDRPKKKVKLVTTGLYGLMRHPVYTFLMLGLSITPKMVRFV